MSPVNRRILVVDDNPSIHDDFRKILCASDESGIAGVEEELFGSSPDRRAGPAFELAFASQGQEALELVKRAMQQDRPYAMAFVDVRMPPGWDGIETISKIWEVDPDLQMAICTAYSDHSLESIAATLRNSANFIILKKPFDVVEVVQLANAFTEKWNLFREVRERTRRFQESEQRYRFLADAVPGLVWTARPDGRVDYVNRRVQQFAGKSFEQIREQGWNALLHPDDIARAAERWNRSAQTGEAYEMEYRLKRAADAAWRWHLARALPLRNAQGQVAHWIGTATDIDDQKRAEAGLRQLQAELETRVAERTEELAGARVRFEHLLRSSPTIIYSRKAEGPGEVTFISHTVGRLLGYQPTEFMENPEFWSGHVHAEDAAAFRDHRFQLLVQEQHAAEYRFRHKDGSYRWLRDEARVIRDAPGAPFEIIGSCTDITGHRQMEATLRQVKGELEQRVAERTGELQAAVLKTQRVLEELAHQKFALDQHAIVAMTDQAGRITYANNKFCAISKYSREELLGQDHRILNSGHHPKEFFTGMYRAITKGQVWHGDIRNRAKDGSIFWLNTTIVPFLGPGGKPKQYIAIRTDITEEKKAELALRENEQRFRQLAESMSQLIWTCQPDGPCDFLSQQWVEYTGIPAADQAGYHWLDQAHPDERSRLQEAWNVALAEGKTLQTTFRIRRHDGSYRWFELRAVPLRNFEGRVIKWFGSNTDIEEHKRAQEEIHKLNTQLEQRVTERTAELQQVVSELAYERDLLRTLMENSPDRIYFKDLQSRFVRVSRSKALRTLQHASPELRERLNRNRTAANEQSMVHDDELLNGLSDMDLLEPEAARRAYEDEQQIIRTGQPLIGQLEKQIEPDGSVAWCLTSKLPWRDRNGTIVGTFGISKDVTNLKQAENERHMIELQLRQAQKLEAIGQLAAGIAHEINTPAQYVGDNTRFLRDSFDSISRALHVYGELLRDVKNNAVTPDLVARVEQSLTANDLPYLFEQIPAAIRESLEGVERVNRIVRAMKEFSHPGGKEMAPADLNKAIETTVTVARNEWKYVAETQLDLDPSLPPIPCFIAELNQAILNLVVNAAHAIGDVVKQSPGTKGTITVRTRRDGSHVEIRVSDTGTGIPESVRPRIFEPFFTTKEVGKGTGQGLSIVYGSIVKRHGGQVSFETEVGKGTTFILRVPITPPAEAEPHKAENSGPAAQPDQTPNASTPQPATPAP